MIIKKCFYYYKFENVMKNFSIINLFFVVEFMISNSNFKKKSSKMKKTSKNENEINHNNYKK